MGVYDFPFNSWPDVEKLAIAQLRTFVGARIPTLSPRSVATQTGPDLVSRLPFLLVAVIPGGGESQSIVELDSVLDVAAFAADRESMWALAGCAHAAVLSLRATSTVDWVTVESAPAYVDFHNPAVYRTEATYRLTTRAQTTV